MGDEGTGRRGWIFFEQKAARFAKEGVGFFLEGWKRGLLGSAVVRAEGTFVFKFFVFSFSDRVRVWLGSGVALTGFPLLEQDLVRTVREAALDFESFQTRVRACDLRKCRGMCCHDGVFVGEEERAVIEEVLPGDHFEQREGRWKTRTVEARVEDLGEGFAEHFPKTRCVFLDEKDHCGLQSLAMEKGEHPWLWKPFPCWLHPLGFRRVGSSARPMLSLPTLGDDPAQEAGYPGFASCTTCGKADGGGLPAWQALRPELMFLSEISGRDLVGELSG